MKQYADLDLTGHYLNHFNIKDSSALTTEGQLRYDSTNVVYKGYFGTAGESALLSRRDESGLSVAYAKAAGSLKNQVKLWGNGFDGSLDVNGTITLGSGKKICFGDDSHYIELVDGVLHTNIGFYSDAFISARGKDDSGSSSGGGANLQTVWESLTGTVAPYASSVINVAHIPTLTTSKITGLDSQISSITSNISTIQDKIPSEATSENKLADKNFVNSSISTATATFRGTVETLAALKALKGDANDYAFYKHTDTAGNTVYSRYKYGTTSSTETGYWTFEYDLNNSSFTAAQWSAINSGITAATISQLKNQNAYSTIKLGDTKASASTTTDIFTFAAGSNVTLSLNSKTLTITAKDTTYSVATTGSAGLMSAADKTKLDGIEVGANLAWNVFEWRDNTGGTSDVFTADAEYSRFVFQEGNNITFEITEGGNGLIISATDSKVTSVTNHYAPIKSTTKSASGGTTTDITNSSSGVNVVTGVEMDAAGHVTGITSKALKSVNTTYSAGSGISISGTTISNSGVRSIASGSAAGTLSVNTGGTSTVVTIPGLSKVATSGKWSDLIGKPTTLSAAGITDGINSVSITGNGNVVNGIVVSKSNSHVLEYNFGTVIADAGFGLERCEGDIENSALAVLVDPDTESNSDNVKYLSVSGNGTKISGINAEFTKVKTAYENAISIAVNGAVFMTTYIVTTGQSKAILADGTIKGITTQYNGSDCICEREYGNSNKTVTVSWGFDVSQSAPMTINVFYVKNVES